jgi:GTP-binding protein
MMGFKPILLGLTKGNITIESHIFDYQPYKGALKRRNSKVVVSTSKAVCTEYGISHLEEKGTAFVYPGITVYEGMLIGETQVDNEILLNPGKEKRLTNVRSVQKEEYSKLSPHRVFTVEEAVAYINEDELVEVTPKSIRLRKKELNFEVRKKKIPTKDL